MAAATPDRILPRTRDRARPRRARCGHRCQGPREIQLADGTRHPWGALLLATGAEPIRLGIPEAEFPHVHTLRSANDCRALIAGARAARRAVVIGASFIGLEVTASLRARGLDVDIVAPETRPMEAVFGAEIGKLVRRVQEQHGVRFHLGTTAAAIDARGVSLAASDSTPIASASACGH
jgi:apoptosis-inducing factor 3